jgi:hypothetical protein
MFMRDILARFVTAVNPTYLDSVKQLARTSMKRGLDSAVYWMASPVGSYDEGYSLLHPNVRQTIAWLDENNVEMGIHPSYETFRSPQKLASEVDAVVRSVGRDRIGGRQHYLRWFPETWLDWEACGLAYDSTVGFHDHIGFRAGTCFPYHPWSISRNREIDLIEIPLIVADSALIKYMRLTPEASLRVVEDCIARCRLVGGVFTLL